MFEGPDYPGSISEEEFETWLAEGRESKISYNFLLIVWNVYDEKLNPVYVENREEIDKTIANLKVLIGQSSVFERKTDYNGKLLFTLTNSEGKSLGKSMLYSSEAGMENGIKNLKTSISLLPDTIDL